MFVENESQLILGLLVNKDVAHVAGQVVDESAVVQLTDQDVVVSCLLSGVYLSFDYQGFC